MISETLLKCSNEARQPACDTHTHTHTQSIKKALKTLGPFVKENEKPPHKNPRIKLEDSSKSSKTPKTLVLNPEKRVIRECDICRC
jgi:hypothetical protein